MKLCRWLYTYVVKILTSCMEMINTKSRAITAKSRYWEEELDWKWYIGSFIRILFLKVGSE